MIHLLDQFIEASASSYPDDEALVSGNARLSYAELQESVTLASAALVGAGLEKGDRVAIYLSKTTENVIGMFGTARAGGVFVPVNPVLKAAQVAHILRDSGARFLLTTANRLASLDDDLETCPALSVIVLTDGGSAGSPKRPQQLVSWSELMDGEEGVPHRSIDLDAVSILYTSGSTGKPKGVVLSHRNMVAGAQSVAAYLGRAQTDRLLAALPFSFDVGFSQLSIAFHTGATAVLHDYFLPRDLVRVAGQERITAITGVPPLWMQVVDQQWPPDTGARVRYFANTGGKMPRSVLKRLRSIFPNARPFLMYGLTEAFRSTYLPPEQVDNRPDSIGKAIPNAEILVVREDGRRCGPGEPGELVHRGALVSMGYWNDPERTAQRFRPVPGDKTRGLHEELAVWSGDIVQMDDEGFLYFVGRRDGMIKTSGYRVSPTEIEEAAFVSKRVGEAAAIGIEDERLGQKIVLIATPAKAHGRDSDALLAALRRELPAYMVPAAIEWRASLPRTPNGKIDRKELERELSDPERESARAS